MTSSSALFKEIGILLYVAISKLHSDNAGDNDNYTMCLYLYLINVFIDIRHRSAVLQHERGPLQFLWVHQSHASGLPHIRSSGLVSRPGKNIHHSLN
jgi:hypothetical protein